MFLIEPFVRIISKHNDRVNNHNRNRENSMRSAIGIVFKIIIFSSSRNSSSTTTTTTSSIVLVVVLVEVFFFFFNETNFKPIYGRAIFMPMII